MRIKIEELFKWLILFITGIYSFIIIFLLFKVLVDKDYLIGLIGASGSIIGGALTLIGVKWTLNEQKRALAQEKYEKANFVFTELLPALTGVYNSVKSLNPFNWNEGINLVEKNAKKLEELATELSIEAKHIGINFYREVKSVEYYAAVIWEEARKNDAGKTDDEKMKNLMIYYNGLAKADNNLLQLVYDSKHQK
ncbi:hypothetical protein D1B31_02020 [Neobacillus notoginsengisoli]|uniref:Uncharacterized protein n=1 Tax=Neobacillus notoginsengisoli TaxID=1578198 RepID=A0A417YZY1_9BACI|nr:hypothetical protein [Neobacillus notoginsengisoli]RHW43460.1 hypothetical protein D1B31_02020 [Neobacillus notoginsengisoli]